MKIGFFTDSFRPYTSGVVRSIELFSREFTARGHEVFIFGPDYPLLHCPREEKVFRFISIPAPTMPDFALPIPISVNLGPTIRRIGLDIIHVHSPFLLGRLGARAARRHKLPLVFTFHTLYDQYVHYLPLAENASRRLVRNISRDFCNYCQLVVTPSQLVENYLRRIGVQVPIKTIPTGVDLNEFVTADPRWLKETYQIGPSEIILLFVGRLGKEKNVTFLLSSFAEVIKTIPEAHLVMVGKGPLENHLRRKSQELGLADKVTFTGMLPRHKVVHCYAGADLFVFPSVTETQGLVIGEAKTQGLPVVAIKAFGAAEMVHHLDDGLLTDPSINSFTEAILKLLLDKELYQKMSKRALNNAALCSSSYFAEQALAAYHHLIEA
ncbi:MAG TPA: glycosyltransferase family 4 protein [Firmicutes bacterium]|nr:glycosyltransferase family 4 protein [Bacillota bacterium]